MVSRILKKFSRIPFKQDLRLNMQALVTDKVVSVLAKKTGFEKWNKTESAFCQHIIWNLNVTVYSVTD